MPNQVRIGVGVTGARGAASEMDKLKASVTKGWNGNEIGKGLVQGLGLAGGLGAAQLLTKGIGIMTDAIGDSIQAARDDQVSIQKLGTTLRDSIPAWDGNTDAIERVLKARMKLGFSDDEQRESLATIVRTTHDVNKALILEAGAMDIARARNVDLATASDAVAKASAGNSKGLKSLIPGLKLGATAAETLANAFDSVKGSADDFAKTEAGRMLVAQTKVNESMEQFGYKILPAVTDAMVGAADAATGLMTTLDLLQQGTAKTVEGQQEQLQGSIDLQKAIAFLFPVFGTLADAEQAALDESMKMADGFDVAGDNSVNMAEAVRGAAFGVGGSFEDMGDDAEDFRDTYRDVTGDIIRRSKRMVDKLVEDAARLRGEVFDETEIRAELHDKRMDLLANQERLRNAKTAESARQASDDVVQALDDEGASLEDLASQGKLTAKDVDRFEADAKKSYKSLSKEGRHQIDLLIARYRVLAGLPNIKKTFTINERHTTGRAGNPGKVGTPEFDKGGVVPGPKGKAIGVIAHGGETVRTAEQEAALRRPGGGTSGGSVTYNVTVNAAAGSGLTAGSARQLATELGPAIYADMQRRGLLPRTGTGLRG